MDQPFSNFWHPPGRAPSRDDRFSNSYASLEINLIHPVRTTQLAIEHFLSSRTKASDALSPKQIIHISSIAGQATPFPAAMYNASKHGINGFVRSLAPLHQGLGIRVTCVAPGVIRTPLWTDNPDKMRFLSEKDEWVMPEDVAEVMGDLVSEEEIEVEAVGAKEGKTKIRVEGGIVLEIAKARKRVVQQYMDPGPKAVEGNTVGRMEDEQEAILKRLERGDW